MNKRGEEGGSGALWIVIAVVALALIAFLPNALGDFSPASLDSTPFSVAIGNENLRFADYIIGGIPQFLIDWTNPISASIIIASIFVILFLTFSDILEAFGTFSNPKLGKIIGFVLALIAANLKGIVLMTYFGFSLAAALGAFAVIVAVGLPFLTFLVLHFALFGKIKEFMGRKKEMKQYETSFHELKQGMRGIKDFGKAMRGDE